MQQLMNEYGTGIRVDEVQLQKADPPVRGDRSVPRRAAAQADRERAQNEAQGFATTSSRAKARPSACCRRREAYRPGAQAAATGEAERFKSILAEYSKAQDVTVRRIYLETMEEVLKGVNKVIIDGKNGNGVVPYLPLPEPRAASPRAAAAARRTAVRERANRDAAHDSSPHGVGVIVIGVLAAVPPAEQPVRREPDPAGAGAAVRQLGPGRPGAGPADQGAVRAAGRAISRSACSTSTPTSVELGTGRPEAPRGRRLRALPHHRRAAVQAVGRQRDGVPRPPRADHLLEPAQRAGRGALFTLLSEDRNQIMDRIRSETNRALAGFGVELVDVRIKRADLPAENSQAIYRRMQTEREREAKELRAQGAEIGQRIRARADRERRVIIAEAGARVADPARPGRRRGDPHLRRGVRPEPRVLRLLPLDAGLSRVAGRRGDELRALAGQRVLPVLQLAAGRPPVQPSSGNADLAAGDAPAPAAAAPPRRIVAARRQRRRAMGRVSRQPACCPAGAAGSVAKRSTSRWPMTMPRGRGATQEASIRPRMTDLATASPWSSSSRACCGRCSPTA